MKIQQILQHCRQHALWGEHYIRENESSIYSKNIKNGIRNGIPVQDIVLNVLKYLAPLNLEAQRSNQLVNVLIVKTCAIVVSSIVIRYFIVKSLPLDLWQEAVHTDRILVIAIGLFYTIFTIVIFKSIFTLSFSKIKQFSIWVLFCDYINFGFEEAKFSMSLNQKLHSIRKSEIQFGTQSAQLKDQLFRSTFDDEIFKIQQDLPKVGYLMIAAELGTFSLVNFALLTMPLLTWAEASQSN